VKQWLAAVSDCVQFAALLFVLVVLAWVLGAVAHQLYGWLPPGWIAWVYPQWLYPQGGL